MTKEKKPSPFHLEDPISEYIYIYIKQNLCRSWSKFSAQANAFGEEYAYGIMWRGHLYKMLSKKENKKKSTDINLYRFHTK